MTLLAPAPARPDAVAPCPLDGFAPSPIHEVPGPSTHEADTLPVSGSRIGAPGLVLLATACVLDAYVWLGVIGADAAGARALRSASGSLLFAAFVLAAAVAALVSVAHALTAMPGAVAAAADLALVVIAAGSLAATALSGHLHRRVSPVDAD